MTFTFYLLGREVFSVALELPLAPIVSDVASMFVPEAVELEEAEEEEDEEEAHTRRVRGQRTGF